MSRLVTFVLGLVCGIACTGIMTGTLLQADEKLIPPTKIDDSKALVAFANAYRIHTTAEETIIDFGINMPVTDTPAGNAEATKYTVTSRVILSYANVRRLKDSLTLLVKQLDEIEARPATKK